MGTKNLIISSGNFTHQSLTGKVVVITGAGGGIGYEAARALLWLGAKVVIAEINPKTGKAAADRLNQAFGNGSAVFIQTDVGDERSVKRLYEQSLRVFKKVDVVINNATIASLGPVTDLPIQDWDSSYRVNIRGPVLLAKAFLPGMIQRKEGVFMCVSSTGVGFMGAYESMKAAQVHLANTLTMELEDSGVAAFTIGPGYAPTQTASSSIPLLAKLMGKSSEEIFESIKGATISIEAAGAGFAAAVVLADRYKGLEISSAAALMDAGIDLPDSQTTEIRFTPEVFQNIQDLALKVRSTLAEQSAGWKQRSIFEQQWMVRSFKQQAGRSVEQWLDLLDRLAKAASDGDSLAVVALHPPFNLLANYYHQLGEMAKGYVKDPAQREKQLGIVQSWQQECEALAASLE